MGTMIPLDSVFMKAMAQSRAMDSNVTPPFAPEPAIRNLGDMGAGRRNYVPGAGSVPTPTGFTLDGPTAYVPEYMPNQRMPEKTYSLNMEMNGTPEYYSAPEEPQAPQQDAGIEQQKEEVEQAAQYGDIPQLLDALRKMASMEPGQGGNPVFQLDEMYKNSSATQGIPGTVAQYPTAGGITRETDYNL